MLRSQSLLSYVRTKEAFWFWIVLAIASATVIVVFTVPGNVYPMAHLRHFLGTVFVFIIPGFCFMKTLFPNGPPYKTSSKRLDSIEQLVLGIGINFGLIPIVGLLLNYSPWGIHQETTTLSLFAFTILFATLGINREHRLKSSKPLE